MVATPPVTSTAPIQSIAMHMQLGVSTEEVSYALERLSTAGIRGAQAGKALARAARKLKASRAYHKQKQVETDFRDATTRTRRQSFPFMSCRHVAAYFATLVPTAYQRRFRRHNRSPIIVH